MADKLYSLDSVAYRSHAIHRKQLDALMSNEWTLPNTFGVLTGALDRYYLLYWSPNYLTEQIKDGMIVHQGISYQVIYTDSVKPNTANNGKWRQIALSFRAATKEYGIHPKVLIKGIPA